MLNIEQSHGGFLVRWGVRLVERNAITCVACVTGRCSWLHVPHTNKMCDVLYVLSGFCCPRMCAAAAELLHKISLYEMQRGSHKKHPTVQSGENIYVFVGCGQSKERNTSWKQLVTPFPQCIGGESWIHTSRDICRGRETSGQLCAISWALYICNLATFPPTIPASKVRDSVHKQRVTIPHGCV